MPFISITRLRLRSWRFVPGFTLHATRSIRQLKAAPGFQDGALLSDRNKTFWTMTAWDNETAMRSYMMNGPHRTAMTHLASWCDEASVVHWHHAASTLPDWPEAVRHMRETGRASHVRFPSPHHANLGFPAPRLTIGTKI